jgi:capsular polysaccharide transport system permease protein
MTTIIKRGPWTIWKDVIFALFAREIRTGFNDKLGIGWAVVSPILFIFVLSFARGLISGADTHGVPTFVFMAFGLLLVQSFLQTLDKSAGAISKNKALFAFRQVQPISAVIAAGLFELVIKIFVMIGIVIMMFFTGMDIQLDDPLLFISCFFLLWICSMAVGLIFGITEMFVPEIAKIRSLASRPLFFLSGVFFSLQDVPKEYWYLLDWNPILHGIELSRYAAYTNYGDTGVSFSFLLTVTFVSLFAALVVYQRFWQQAISR